MCLTDRVMPSLKRNRHQWGGLGEQMGQTGPMQNVMNRLKNSVVGDIDMSSLGGVFYILVMGCIMLAVGIFFMMFIVCLYAIFSRMLNEWDQTAKLKQTPLLIKDTTDWKTMDYIFNDINRDPYYIYFQQTLLSNVFGLLALAIFLMLFQGAIYLGMGIWAHLRNEDFNEKFKHNVYVLGIGVVFLIIAFILRMIYNKQFLDNTQAPMRDMSSAMISVKEKLYDAMSLDTAFLSALTEGSTYTLTNLITSAASSFQQSKTPETHSLVKMAFTYNVYKFFNDAIPNHNRATFTLRDVFTANGIKQRKMLLPILFVYQTPPMIPNSFLLDFKTTLEQALGAQGFQQFTVALQERMTSIEKGLRTLPDVEKAKGLVSSFMNKYIFTIVAYFILLIAFIVGGRWVYQKISGTNTPAPVPAPVMF